MGRSAAATVARQLIAAGRAPQTPVLIVVNATLADERIIHGHLASLAFLVETVGADDPAMLIIGEVAAALHGTVATSAVDHTPVPSSASFGEPPPRPCGKRC
jgi:siroheme synthase